MDAYLAGLEQAQADGHDLSQHPLGRLVLRLPRRHRDRQAAGRDRHRRGAGAARQGRRSPTPGWRTRRTRRSSPASAGAALDEAGANPQRPLWASTGVKNPDYPDTLYVTDLVVAGHRQHDAGEDPRGVRRPRRGHRRPGHRRATPRPGRCSTTWPRSASTTTTSSRCSRARASRSSRRPGTSCVDTVASQLDKADRSQERTDVTASRSPPPATAVELSSATATRRPSPLGRAAGRRPVRQPAVRPGRHAVGPEAEEEAAKRLAWVDAAADARGRWSARSTRCASELPARARPRRAVRHGRLVAGPRGDLRRRRRRR